MYNSPEPSGVHETFIQNNNSVSSKTERGACQYDIHPIQIEMTELWI